MARAVVRGAGAPPRWPYLADVPAGNSAAEAALLRAVWGEAVVPDAVPRGLDALRVAMPNVGEAVRVGTPLAARSIDPDCRAVIVLIDEGIPLLDLARSNRLVSYWLQDAPSRKAGSPWLPYGRDAHGELLMRALRTAPPAPAALAGADLAHDVAWGVQPGRVSPGRMRLHCRATHGAAVLGEVVRRTDPVDPVVAVTLPPEAVRDTAGHSVPYHVLTGLLHGMAVARAIGAALGRSLPVVAVVSYGILAGPKDGSSPFERALDAIADPGAAVPGLGPVDVILPMGNGRLSATVARLDGQRGDVAMVVPPDDRTPTFVEVRAEGDGSPAVSLAPPGGVAVPLPPDGVTLVGGVPVRTRSMAPWGPGLLVELPPTAGQGLAATGPLARPGRWTVRRTGNGALHLAIQRDDSLPSMRSGGRQARFEDPAHGTSDASGRPRLEDFARGRRDACRHDERVCRGTPRAARGRPLRARRRNGTLFKPGPHGRIGTVRGGRRAGRDRRCAGPLGPAGLVGTRYRTGANGRHEPRGTARGSPPPAAAGRGSGRHAGRAPGPGRRGGGSVEGTGCGRATGLRRVTADPVAG